MSSKYDIESYLNEVVGIIQENLPAKIIAINTEKSDSITLATIANEDYYVDASEQIWNKNQFIYYGIIDLSTTTNGAKTAIEITLNFEVVFNNTNQSNTLERVLRYSRCLREVIQDNFKGKNKSTGFSVSELVPANAPLNEGSDFKIGGIEIISTIIG